MRADRDVDDELEHEFPALAALAKKSPEFQELVRRLVRDDRSAQDSAQETSVLDTSNGESAQDYAPKAFAEPPSRHIYDPSGKRQTKRRQRRVLFSRLRAGASRQDACAAAGITLDVLEEWMDRPEFRESVMQAEGFRHEEAWDEYDSTTWR